MSLVSLSEQIVPSTANLHKRRRLPSQYADRISELKKNQLKSFKRIRQDNSSETIIDHSEQDNFPTDPIYVPCVLPTGRRILLSVVVRRNQHISERFQGVAKKRSSRESLGLAPSLTAMPMESTDLLSKFLMAAEELNRLEKVQKEAVEFQSWRDLAGLKPQEKRDLSKERVMKMMRFYERSQQLEDTFENTTKNYFEV